ncbi:MAG: hypothetical protein PHQ43_15060, partial [Dehalococcoidales bacterium]|nr:hypothetical protein [Dehalococcoidales bacterium]
MTTDNQTRRNPHVVPGQPIPLEQPTQPTEPKPQAIPPVQPSEYFPGFQQQFQQATAQTLRAAKRVEAAQARMQAAIQPWQWRQFGVTSGGLTVLPFWPASLKFIPPGQLAASKEDAQAELDAATREYTRASWRQTVLNGLPFMLADDESGVRTEEDVLRALPNRFANDEDNQWLQDTFKQLQYLAPTATKAPVKDKTGLMLETLTGEQRLPTRGLAGMTREELARYFTPQAVTLPKGLTTEDIRDLSKSVQLDEDTQKQLEDIHSAAEQFKQDWADQAATINLIRAGSLTPEGVDLTPVEFWKVLLVQPALATSELFDKYFHMLPDPLAAAAILGGRQIFRGVASDADAAQLERLYQQYRAEGDSAWESLSKAYDDWDTNIFIKMLASTAFDPTTYIGYGLLTKAAQMTKLPRLGAFVGALDRGWNATWDIPFKALRQAIKRIPMTPTQAAFSYARQALMDSRAYFRRFTGKDLAGMTVAEIRDAAEFAVKAVKERPNETGDLAVRIGRYLTDYGFLEKEQVKDFLKSVKVADDALTTQRIVDVNYIFDKYFRKTLTVNEAAGQILAGVGVDATEKNIGAVAKAMERHADSIYDAATDLIRGDNPRDVLNGILATLKDTELSKIESPIYQFVHKTGKITSWVGQHVDQFTHSTLVTKIDRAVTAPLANQYLLFLNYGPFNVLENSLRSFLGAGEVFYPKVSSPLDELLRISEGITTSPYELAMAAAEHGRLEVAVTDPKTNKT